MTSSASLFPPLPAAGRSPLAPAARQPPPRPLPGPATGPAPGRPPLPGTPVPGTPGDRAGNSDSSRNGPAASLLLFPEEPGAARPGPANRNPVRRPAAAAPRMAKSRPMRPERYIAPDPAITRAAWYATASPVVWFDLRGRNELPPVPFPLLPGNVVCDRDRWLASVDRDITAGPAGPRAEVLLQELAALREFLSARSRP